MGQARFGRMGSGLGWSANSAKEGHLEVRQGGQEVVGSSMGAESKGPPAERAVSWAGRLKV